ATSKGAYWSLIGGGVGTISWAAITWIVTGDPSSTYLGISPVYVGFALSIILLILISNNTPHTEDEDVDKFLLKRNKKANTNNLTRRISIKKVYSHFIQEDKFNIKYD